MVGSYNIPGKMEMFNNITQNVLTYPSITRGNLGVVKTVLFKY